MAYKIGHLSSQIDAHNGRVLARRLTGLIIFLIWSWLGGRKPISFLIEVCMLL